jgi:hypothetical protein
MLLPKTPIIPAGWLNYNLAPFASDRGPSPYAEGMDAAAGFINSASLKFPIWFFP